MDRGTPSAPSNSALATPVLSFPAVQLIRMGARSFSSNAEHCCKPSLLLDQEAPIGVDHPGLHLLRPDRRVYQHPQQLAVARVIVTRPASVGRHQPCRKRQHHALGGGAQINMPAKAHLAQCGHPRYREVTGVATAEQQAGPHSPTVAGGVPTHVPQVARTRHRGDSCSNRFSREQAS